jgi:hypothetical protein
VVEKSSWKAKILLIRIGTDLGEVSYANQLGAAWNKLMSSTLVSNLQSLQWRFLFIRYNLVSRSSRWFVSGLFRYPFFKFVSGDVINPAITHFRQDNELPFGYFEETLYA